MANARCSIKVILILKYAIVTSQTLFAKIIEYQLTRGVNCREGWRSWDAKGAENRDAGVGGKAGRELWKRKPSIRLGMSETVS